MFCPGCGIEELQSNQFSHLMLFDEDKNFAGKISEKDLQT
ncbi:hypothetical protein BH20ACI4_BH20ACI4_13190 [soil metagenome]